MNDIKRWYDESPKLSEMLDILSNMSPREITQISKYLYQIVNIYQKQKKSDKELLSIGTDKLFSYYKAYNKRRWYDKNPSLSSALNTMSTLEVKEIEEIVDGFLIALKEAGLYSIYSSKKKELTEKENT